MANLNRDDIRRDTIYMDKNGNRVRVTGIDEENVHWAAVDENRTGNTNIANFLREYQPEREAA